MYVRGKWIILTLFGISLAAALFAVWFNYRLTRRTTATFGPDVVQLIARAPKVELLVLDVANGDGSPETSRVVTFDGRTRKIVRARDISQAAGLIHARYALRQDASFDWDGHPRDCEPSWGYALRFSDDHAHALLIVETQCGLLHIEPGGADVQLGEKLLNGLRLYFDEQLGNDGDNAADVRKKTSASFFQDRQNTGRAIVESTAGCTGRESTPK